MLEISNVEVVYNEVILVLRGLSLVVPDGRIVALLGANGAGKTTTLRAITGLLDIHDGVITKGTVTFDGQRLDQMQPAAIVRAGVTQVMEGVPGLLAKDGAEGVYAAGLADGSAVAFKIEDGSGRARPPVLAEALRRLGGDLDDLVRFLASCRSDRGFFTDLRPPVDVMIDVVQPTLVLATRNDAAVGFDHPERLAGGLRRGRLWEIDSPSHLLWLGDGWRWVQLALTSFLG